MGVLARRRLPWEMSVEMFAEAFRRCVLFVYRERPGEPREPWGTACIVCVFDGRDPPVATFYIVTAGHVSSPVDANGNPHRLFLRWPHRRGTDGEYQIVDADRWDRESDTDLAIMRVDGDLPVSRSADGGYWPVYHTQLGGPDNLLHIPVEEGDAVFAVGLFSQHPGGTEPQPVYRFGNVSLLPREPVLVRLPGNTRREIEAYLIEAHSWGGQSGSPVFLSLTRAMISNEPAPTSHSPVMLGLIQGHFDIPRAPQREQAGGEPLGYESTVEEMSGVRVPINAGMAIVIPAHKITEMLMSDAYVNSREEAHEEAVGRADAMRPAGTPDAADEPTERGEFERFEELTDKLLRVPKKELDDKLKES